MLLEIVIAVTTAILTIVIGQVLITMARNYKKQQFFKLKSPNIPVIPNASLLGGHINQTVNGKQNWRRFDELHKKYGKTYGWFYNDKPVVSTTDLDLIKGYIMDQPQGNTNRLQLDVPYDEIETDTIGFAEDEQWLRLRRSIAPAFSTHRIKSPNVQGEISDCIEQFIESIEKRLDEAKEQNKSFIIEDAEDIFHRYALALVFTCFYKQENLVDFNSKKDYYVELVQQGSWSMFEKITCLPTIFPRTKPFFQWLLMNFTSQGETRDKIWDFVTKHEMQNSKAVAEMRTNETGELDVDNFYLKDGSKFRRNMIDYITEEYHAGKMTKSEYYHNSFFIFFAANKTSADAISKLIYHLAIYPEVQEKLRDSIMKEGVESDYLLWTIFESMRLYPPTLVGCLRVLTQDVQTDVGLIPAGTCVCPSVYTINRMEEYWGSEPGIFKPERWSNSANFHPMQNLAFGLGKRNCPGREFAITEIKMLMNALLRKFKFERATKEEEEPALPFEFILLIFALFNNPAPVKISYLEEE